MLRAAAVPREFYLDPPDVVAPRLLGKLLVRRLDNHEKSHGGKGNEGESCEGQSQDGESQVLAGRIVEVEAYFGTGDPAAHAFAGQTTRNAVLFGPPGHAYVYLIYGMHYCLNVSCEPDGRAGCVLIRALEPVSGLAEMARLRKLAPGAGPALLTSGPGRLCQALNITRSAHDGMDLTDPRFELHVVADDCPPPRVLITPRIGISKAADRPLRYCVEGSRFVTRSPLRPQRRLKTGLFR